MRSPSEFRLASEFTKPHIRIAMVTHRYREANELADLLDFYEDGAKADPSGFADLIAGTRADLAKQERIDGKPADPREQRQGFLGAI